MEVVSRPKVVGRDNEIGKLVESLARAANGNGDVFLIAGEAGVGKTRVIQELVTAAESTGFRIISGGCMHDSRTPYLPFQEALRSGEMGYLFAEESPRVEAAYLVTSTGIPVKEVLRQTTGLDPDIFASMLSAVGNFVKEAMTLMSGQKRDGFLNSLGFGEYRILIEGSSEVNLVVIITGKENEFLIEDMRDALSKVRSRYGALLRDWDGAAEDVKGVEDIIEPIVFSGKYDGTRDGIDDPKARRNLLFENVSLGLTRHSLSQPVLLCIEDLQWADPSSLALFQYVARIAPHERIVVVGTYQPEDVAGGEEGRSLAETIQLMSRDNRIEKIELRRLPREVTHDLLVSMLGNIGLGPRFEGWLYDRTEGNPLYITEIVRMMIEEGTIISENGAWRLSRDVKETEIPSRIHDVVTRKLDRLRPEEKRLLVIASVIGAQFPSGVLARAAGLDRVKLLERLSDLEKVHKLVRPNNEEWRFDQSMIREVLYNGIPLELRKEYHWVVAESIESLNKDRLEGVLGRLALHYFRSGNKEKALPYLIDAADSARRSFSNQEAMALYSEAIQLTDSPKEKLEFLERIGDIREMTGEYTLSLKAYGDAIALAQDPRKRGALKAKMGKVHNRRGEHSESLRISSEALELVEGTDSEAEALALNNLGVSLWGRGEREKATEFFQKVLAIRTVLGDKRGIASATLNIGLMDIEVGRFETAIKHLTESLAGFDQAGDLSNVALVYNNLGNVYTLKGEPTKALHWYARAMRMRERIGDQRGIAYSMGNIGSLNSLRGDHDKALHCYQSAMRIGDRISDQRIVAYSLCSIGLVHCVRGELERAQECEERGLSVSGNIGDQSGIAQALHNLGVVHIAKGDHGKAISYLERSRSIREKTGNKAEVSETCSRTAEAYMGMGDYAKAEEQAEMALRLSKEVGAKEFTALAQMVLGKVHRERKNWKESMDNFEESLRYFEDAGMRTQLGMTHCEYGMMLKEKGDKEKAAEHLKLAAEAFRQMRMAKGLDMAELALTGLATIGSGLG